MSSSRTWLTAGIAGLAIGAAGALALRPATGTVAPANRLPADAPTTCACANGGAAAPSPAPPTAVAPGAPRLVPAPRFTVCAREESPARLTQLALGQGQPPLWALHCGQSVHLIALRDLEGGLVPERVARIDLPRPGPTEAGVTTEVAAADLDGDRRADLIVPTLLVDRAGAPSGGALLQLRQRPEGGLAAPVRLFDAAPAAAVALALDAQPGEDLALLQRQDSANHRPDELWLVQGGRAPSRIARLDAGVAATALVALDLDLDRSSDLAVASSNEGKLRLFLSRRGPLAQTAPIALELPGVQSAVRADLDGDGQPDLLLAQPDRLVALLARAELDPAPTAIATAQPLRDLAVIDVNADRKPDIVGYAHPTLVLLTQNGELAFESKPLALVRGEGSVLRVQIAQLDRDPRPEAVFATISGESVELAVARNLDTDSTIELGTPTVALRNAAWLQQFAAP